MRRFALQRGVNRLAGQWFGEVDDVDRAQADQQLARARRVDHCRGTDQEYEMGLASAATKCGWWDYYVDCIEISRPYESRVFNEMEGEIVAVRELLAESGWLDD